MKSAAMPKLSAASAMGLALAATIGAICLPAAPALAGTASVDPEDSDVVSLPTPKPGWFYVQRGFVQAGTGVYDSTTGKYLAQVETPVLGDMAIDPAGKHYYVAESVWTRRLHGKRQDFISVYDSTGLKLEGDIDIPGRMLVGGRLHNFIVSEDGKTGYVYNFNPVSSVNVIDLAKRKFVKTFELPGCADIVTYPGVGLAALCSDGSIASINLKGAKEEITRTEPFFNATNDPIFDNFAYDKSKAQMTMLTYTGLVYTAKLGAKPEVSTPFSIQEAAGIRKGDIKPLEVNWFPGGGQPLALHYASNHLFVLMHTGEFWSHKAGATEIWDVDVTAHKVVKRLSVSGEPNSIQVTQEAKPHLIVAGDDEVVQVIDPATGEVKNRIKDAGPGPIQIAE